MRQIYGGGRRGGWQEPITGVPVPFQRANGTVMSKEEIAAVGAVDASVWKNEEKPKSGRGVPISEDEAARAWEAVKRLGTQSDAARELGMDQQKLQTRMRAYQRFHGLSGPLPGIQSSEQLSERHRVPGLKSTQIRPPGERHRFGAVYEPLEVAAHRDEGDADEPRSDAEPSADEKAIKPFTHILAPAGYHELDTPMPVEHRAIDSLVDWLTERGPTWTQQEAERWFKALTATIDLTYPTHEGAA
ncbi:MAG: hypothetical protein QOJ81_1331 [Chloroflexota bacterium]|jgi:hypothetical protein|nr:hypothetical protein [Chloroflexota bacterium]